MLEHGMMRAVSAGGSTLYDPKVDFFGDGSGKALWRLDGNANDAGGNYHGTETAVTYGGGVYERGAIFNGTSSNIVTTYTAQSSTQVTMSAWIKVGATGGADRAIFSDYDGSSYNNTRLMLGVRYTGHWFLAVGNGASSWINYDTYSCSAVLDNVWHHVALTINGTQLKIYVDGVLAYSPISTVSLSGAGTQALRIGKHGLFNGYWWNGLIDQARIFTKELSQSEVTQLYTEAEPTSIVNDTNPFMDGSLKALYRFDGDATDATGTYNGTATNITYGTGKFGQCAVFNGSTATVVNSSVPSLGLYSTMSAWVYTTLTTTQAIAEYSNGTNLIAVYYDSTAIKVRVNALLYSVTKTIPKSVFNHISVVLFNDVPSLYLDGTKLTLTSSAVTAIAGTSGLRVGVANVATVQTYMSGSIDQVRIFNKALTPMEVAALYNETTPLEEPMYKLVDPFRDGSGKALYRLDGNALDESGNYNGTAIGVTYGTGQYGRSAFFNGGSITFPTISTAKAVSFWTNKPLTNGTFSSFFTSEGNYVMFCTGDPSTAFTDETLLLHDGASYTSVYTTSVFDNTSWKHITISFIALGSYVFTINGTSVPLVYIGATVNMLPLLNTMGLRATSLLNGSMDQVRFFDRALTSAEVTTLYTEI